MDPTSFAAPAHVKALVVPLGPITVGQFQQHFDRSRRAAEVPLIDVHLPSEESSDQNAQPTSATSTSAANSTNSTFDPSANPTGHLKYSFETSPVTDPHMSLVDLEPWRQQFLTVGIVHADSKYPLEAIAKSSTEMRKIYSKSIYHVVSSFDTEDSESSKGHIDIGTHIFPIEKSNITSSESTLSTSSGHFSGKLSNFWTVRQLSSFQSPSALLKSAGSPSQVHTYQHPVTGKRSHAPRYTSHTHHHHHSPSGVSLGRHGSISMNSAERAKSRQDGRTRKFSGNLYLLSGRISDALTESGMAATVSKEHDDHLWLGSALNDIGLCLVIQKYEKGQHGIPSTAVAAAWSMASQHSKKTKNVRSSSSHSATASTSSIQSSNGPSSIHSNPNSSPRRRDSRQVSGSLPDRSAGQRRDSVSTIAEGMAGSNSAGSSASSSAGSPTSSMTLSRIASLRKSKPFTDQTPVEDILEYIISAALEEYAQGEDFEIVPYTVYYEAIVRYANLMISLRFGQGWTEHALATALGEEISLDTSNPADHPTLLDIEAWISKVYEISSSHLEPDIQALISGSIARLYARAGLKRKWAFTCAQIVSILASSRATVHTDLGQVAEVLQVYTTWPKSEAQMSRKLIPLGQRIQNAKSQTDAASRLLALVCSDDYPMMDKDQMTLYHLISSYSDVTQANFWDPDSVETASIKAHRLSSSRSNGLTSASSPRSSIPNQQRNSITSRSMSATSTGPFIYNPFDAVEPKEKGSIETGVQTTARISLRNPSAIDIQVFELALVNKQNEMISDVVKNVTIPPNTAHFKVDVAVMPPEGISTLIISGCHVQVAGCASQIYPIPVIEVPVIPARPVLALQKLSLLKGWTMLSEGECKRFSITSWNSSNVANKILHFGFNDSTVDSMRTASSRPDVTRSDFYEHEYFLHKRRAIDLVDDSKMEESSHIDPQASRTFEFDLTGKRGVNAAAVSVDYGLSENTLRRLKIPLQVTIYPSINVERANILPSKNKNAVLLIVDLRNLWRESLTCKLWADGSEIIEHGIDSSSTRRLVLEVPWEPSSPEELKRPIPSMSSRQYTVDTRTSPEQSQIFWLREKSLNRIHGEWFNDKGRHGYIESRSIKLSKRMGEASKNCPIEVTATLSKTPPQVDEAVSMTVNIVNNSSRPVQGILRLVANKPAQRYMLVLGCQQQSVTIPVNERAEATFEMVFSNRGTVESSSVLDPLDLGFSEPVFQTEKTVVHI